MTGRECPLNLLGHSGFSIGGGCPGCDDEYARIMVDGLSRKEGDCAPPVVDPKVLEERRPQSPESLVGGPASPNARAGGWRGGDQRWPRGECSDYDLGFDDGSTAGSADPTVTFDEALTESGLKREDLRTSETPTEMPRTSEVQTLRGRICEALGWSLVPDDAVIAGIEELRDRVKIAERGLIPEEDQSNDDSCDYCEREAHFYSAGDRTCDDVRCDHAALEGQPQKWKRRERAPREMVTTDLGEHGSIMAPRSKGQGTSERVAAASAGNRTSDAKHAPVRGPEEAGTISTPNASKGEADVSDGRMIQRLKMHDWVMAYLRCDSRRSSGVTGSGAHVMTPGQIVALVWAALPDPESK